jgi:hypothetical protein
MDLLTKLIDNRLKYLQCERHEVYPELLIVKEPEFFLQLENDILVMNNKSLDIPRQANLLMVSPVNFLNTSKDYYDNLSDSGKQQFFEKSIEIILRNYGNEFREYVLEFIRIKPIFK